MQTSAHYGSLPDPIEAGDAPCPIILSFTASRTIPFVSGPLEPGICTGEQARYPRSHIRREGGSRSHLNISMDGPISDELSSGASPSVMGNGPIRVEGKGRGQKVTTRPHTVLPGRCRNPPFSLLVSCYVVLRHVACGLSSGAVVSIGQG